MSGAPAFSRREDGISDNDQTIALPGTGPAPVTVEPAPAAGWAGLLTGRNGIYSLALAGGVMLYAVNMYLATTVMPSAAVDIGGMRLYAWATTLFVMASILGAALAARLLAARGPRSAYLVASAIFGIGCLICALAPNMPVMLAGRSVQGFGGGILYSLSYGLTRMMLPEALWSRAIALISAMFGLATLIGPAVGGVFAEYDVWRAAFWSLVPLAMAFALIAALVLPRQARGTVPVGGVPMVQLSLLAASVLLVSAGSLADAPVLRLGSLVLAILLAAAIAFAEGRTRVRLLPRGAFDVATPLGALYLTIALLVFAMQPEVFVPYLLQVLHGLSPLWAGYVAVLMAMGWTIGSIASARWQERHGDALIVSGPVLMLAGLVLLGLTLPSGGGDEFAELGPAALALLLVGLGIGIAWPDLVTRIYRYSPPGEQELAAGGMTTVQLFATAFGAAAAGMVANFAGVVDPGGEAGAANAALWLSFLFAFVPALALFAALRVARHGRG